MWLVLIKSKDQAFSAFKKIKAASELQVDKRLKILRTDRGGEFTSAEFNAFCENEGIERQLTAPYSPQQNGVVERRNQTVVAMARSLLKSQGMPGLFWGEAVTTAVYLLNRSPTKSVVGKTAYEAWREKKPSVEHLRTFGCTAHVKVVGPTQGKLADRSIPMVFIGYERSTKAYRLYNPETKRICVSRDVVFEEGRKWNWESTNLPSEDDNGEYFIIHMESENTSDTDKPQAPGTIGEVEVYTPQKGGGTPPSTPGVAASAGGTTATPSSETTSSEAAEPRTPQGHVRIRSLQELYDETEPSWTPTDLDHIQDLELCMLGIDEPAHHTEALKHETWRLAMEEELKSIQENDTWELTTLPAGVQPIGLKWVFKLKKDAAGNVIRHKAHLVAKGYVQQHGIDFDEVFAPVARMETVRLLLAVAAQEGWDVHHLDVKSAFLNGELEEEVYVMQPSLLVLCRREMKIKC